MDEASEPLVADKKVGDEEDVDEHWRAAFSKFDKDGNGTIDKDELVQVLQELGHAPTPDQQAKMFANMDTNADGTVSFAEFCHAVRGFEAPRGADSTGSQAARYAADRVGQGLMAQALTPETGLSMLRLASNPTNLVVASASSATGGLAGGQNAPGDPKNQAGSMGGLGCCWCITIALCILEIVMGAKVLGSGDPCGRMGKMMVCAGALAMVCCSACVSNGMQNRGKVQVGVGANSAGAASNALGCLCCLSYLALIGVLIWGATIFYSPATAAQCAGLEGGKPFRTGYWLTTFFFVYLGTMVPLVILLCACCWVAVAAMGMAGFIDAAQRGDINQLRAARTGFSGAGRNQEGPDNTDAPDVQAPDNV